MDPVYYRNSASKLVVIKNIAEAERALRMRPWKRTKIYAKALQTVDEALAGNCTPRSARAAFVDLIIEQGILVPRPGETADPLTHGFPRSRYAESRSQLQK